MPNKIIIRITMKKTLLIVTMALVIVTKASAQETRTPIKSQFTLNTRAWSTNYWTCLLYNFVRDATCYLIFDNDPTIEAFLPESDLTFPVGLAKAGFVDPLDIHTPYHRAFATPFAQMGDFGIGLDCSWTPTAVGIYAGAYYKSQELCFISDGQNLRGNYFQPRAGLVLGGKSTTLEAGVFYDLPLSCTGTSLLLGNPDKSMIQDGWGLDFAISHTNKANTRKNMLMFSMPLHNFINEGYAGGLTHNLKRKVGYIMLSRRIIF